MKSTITILAAVLTLQAGILFAGNETTTAPVANASALISLAPVTPVEATFEDINATTIDIAAIAFSVPSEADFSDVAPDTGIKIMNLLPATPAEADFDDSVDVTIDIIALVLVTPATADFE